MTNTQQLLASFDGKIPPGMLRRASDLDRAEARATIRARGCRIGRIRYKPASIPARMAAEMVRRRREQGECTYQHLLAAGFTPADIRAHGNDAKAEAARQWAATEGAAA